MNNKLIILYMIFTLSEGISYAQNELSCADQKKCSLVWDNFNSANKSLITNDPTLIQQHKLSCDPTQSLSWSSDGKSLTIKYLGRENNLSKTCYIKTDKILTDKDGNRIDHGYISADMFVEAELKDAFVWPAFWLLGSPSDSSITWPSSGEVDITEHLFSTTYSNLIGDPNNTFGSSKLTLTWPPGALAPSQDKKIHSYGLEWEILPDKVVLTYYWDNQKLEKYKYQQVVNGQVTNQIKSSQTALKEGGIVTETNIYRAFANNWYTVILDSDRFFEKFVWVPAKTDPKTGKVISAHTETIPDKYPQSKSSLTITNLKVYKILDAAPLR